MLHRLTLSSFLIAALVTPSLADEVIVFEDFESYTDDATMRDVWVPNGTVAQDPFLFDFNTDGQPYTDLAPPAPGSVDGKAVFFDGTSGGFAKYANEFSVMPTEAKNVVLSADIAHDMLSSNKRLTVGLRYTGDVADNLVELGFYNSFPVGPNGEFYQFGYRTAIMPGNTDWQRAMLPENKDQLFEIGDAGFHTFTAIISTTDITFTIDLFGDGINNGTGEPGLDSTDVVPAVTTANGFNDIRFGGPSGIVSGDPFLAVDNISLRLVDVVAPPGDDADFDGDGDVDGRDFLIWQRGFGIDDGTAQLADGDANDDGNVDGLDLPVWQNQYGQANLPAQIAAVPEPSTLLLLAVTCGLLATRRK